MTMRVTVVVIAEMTVLSLLSILPASVPLAEVSLRASAVQRTSGRNTLKLSYKAADLRTPAVPELCCAPLTGCRSLIERTRISIELGPLYTTSRASASDPLLLCPLPPTLLPPNELYVDQLIEFQLIITFSIANFKFHSLPNSRSPKLAIVAARYN